MNVLIAGGGTAGHVNPALALAHELRPDSVTFVGTERGVEARLVPDAGWALETIEVRGFDRSRPWALPAVGVTALGAVQRCRTLIARLQPDVVVGMGGYVSLPACLAARSKGCSIVLHEQNIVLGLANKVSRPLARKVGVSFEQTLADVKDKGVFTGNPVIPSLVGFDRERARAAGRERFGLEPDRSTLLVFGGSLGARRVNEAAAGLARLWSGRTDRQIVHITGRTGYEAVESAVAAAGAGESIYRVEPYVEDMAEAYAVADLALCRGGATTVAELGVTGLPSIIVPYPYHRDRQQERHGRVLESHGAARVLLDADTTAAAVDALATPLLDDPAALERMAGAARTLGRPDAAARLAALVREAAA